MKASSSVFVRLRAPTVFRLEEILRIRVRALLDRWKRIDGYGRPLLTH